MSASALHIVFTPSGALDLRKAIEEVGRDDRVVALFDCLSFGPINPPDPVTRSKWVEDVLGYSSYDDVLVESEPFWQAALAPENRKIVWLSRRSTQEYAGFLEWLWRLGDAPFCVVDVTDVMAAGTPPLPAVSLGLLPAYRILELGLLDRAEEFAPEAIEQYRALWERLRRENAPLRAFKDGELASAPISHFDPLLLSHAESGWRKTAWVVGSALTDFWDSNLLQTGDLLLFARVRALVEAGMLEAQGDISDIHRSEVRLSSAPRQ
jgi:hypothetical protein